MSNSVFPRAFLCIVLLSGVLHAMPQRQDSLTLSLREAEARFMTGNLQLLAGRFTIDAARAAVRQAGLWTNPNLGIEQNVYNQYTSKYFDVTSTGNTDVSIQQLFVLAGKRDTQVSLAAITARNTEQSLSDLLRVLTLELRSDYFALYFTQRSLALYDESLATLRRTVQAVDSAFARRSLLLSEVLRLKTLLFTLENERFALASHAGELESEMRVLMHDSSDQHYRPAVDEQQLDAIGLQGITADGAVTRALECRPDFLLTQAAVEYESTNLSLQKAMAIPDLTLGGHWSRAGSYIPEYYAVTLSIDLPLFNRNQGNIEMSESTLAADRAVRDQARLIVERDVRLAYHKAAALDDLYRHTDRSMIAQYRTLINGMAASYEQRNITIIAFTDFFESYRTSMQQLEQLANDRIAALCALNCSAATPLIDIPSY